MWWPGVLVDGWVGSSVGRCDVGARGAGCRGGDDPTDTELTGERGRDRAEHRSVFVVELGSAVLAFEDGELVAEHNDLEVLGVSRPHGEMCQHREEPLEEAIHENPGCGASCLVSAHGRITGTHRPGSGWVVRWMDDCRRIRVEMRDRESMTRERGRPFTRA